MKLNLNSIISIIWIDWRACFLFVERPWSTNCSNIFIYENYVKNPITDFVNIQFTFTRVHLTFVRSFYRQVFKLYS